MPEVITGQDSASAYEAQGGAEEAAKVDAARAELYDEANGATEAASSGEGELILGKYKGVEDLTAAYQSLQREYTRLKTGQAAPAEEAPVDPAPAPEGDDVEDEPADTDEADEADAGSSQVDPATVARIHQSVIDQAGGEAEYQRLASWAAANLPAERTNAYNEALQKADEGAIINALKGLQYDYMMKHGYEPKLTGGRAPSNEIRGFSSESQVIEAMKDPRYSGDRPDPAYIREVEKRLSVSDVFQTR